jgi:hypothetical protein
LVAAVVSPIDGTDQARKKGSRYSFPHILPFLPILPA